MAGTRDPLQHFLVFAMGAETAIADDSRLGATITPTGANAPILSAVETKFGTKSASRIVGGDSTQTNYLSVPGHADYELPGEFTIEGWWHATEWNGFQSLLGSISGAGAPRFWFPYQTSSGLLFFINNPTGSSQNAAWLTADLPLDAWTHVVITRERDGINDLFRLWVDGVYKGTTSAAAFTTSFNVNADGIGVGYSDQDASSKDFEGYYDDVRVYTVAKHRGSTSSITVPTAPQLPVYDTGDQFYCNVKAVLADDDTFTDLVGATVATEGDPALSAVTAQFGSQSILQGDAGNNNRQDYTSLNDDDSGFIWDGEFTVEGWFRLITHKGSTNVLGSGYSDGTWGQSSWTVQVTAAGNVSWFEGNGQSIAGTGTPMATLNVWHHIAVTRDADNIVRTFVDGVLNGTSVVYADTLNDANSGFINQEMRIGAGININNNYDLHGYYQSIRVMKGYCAYYGNFPVPTAAFGAPTRDNIDGTSVIVSDRDSEAAAQNHIGCPKIIARDVTRGDTNWMLIGDDPDDANISKILLSAVDLGTSEWKDLTSRTVTNTTGRQKQVVLTDPTETIWVLAGNDIGLESSADLETWTSRSSPGIVSTTDYLTGFYSTNYSKFFLSGDSATNANVMMSADGITWAAMNSRPSAMNTVKAIGVNETTGRVLLAGDADELYYTDNPVSATPSTTYTAATISGMAATGKIACDDVLTWMITDGATKTWISEDDGDTWALDNTFTGLTITDIAYDSGDVPSANNGTGFLVAGYDASGNTKLWFRSPLTLVWAEIPVSGAVASSNGRAIGIMPEA